MRLFKQLLLIMLVLALVPTAIFGGLAVSANREALVTLSLEVAQERVEKLRLSLAQQVTEATRSVEGAATRELGALDQAERQAVVAQTITSRDDLAVVTLLGADGEKLPGLQAFPTREVTPTEVAEHDSRARLLFHAFDSAVPAPGIARASTVYLATRSGEPAMTVVVGVPQRPGAAPAGEPAVAAVAAEIRLGAVQRIIEAQRFGPNGEVYVVDAAGAVIAHPDRALARRRESVVDHPIVAAFLAARPGLLASGGAKVGAYPGEDGAARIAAFAAVPALEWGVIYEQPEASAYAQVTRARDRALVGLVVAGLIAALLAWVAAQGVTRPIKAVVDGALKIATGAFGAEVKVASKNELGDLAHTFNYMSKQLLAYDAETRGLYASLENGYMETIIALANSIDSKDAYTRGHSQRVADISRAIGEDLGLTTRELKHLTYGGILHDVGKIGIVERILCKRDRLTPEEMEVMRAHPEIGGTIIEPVGFLAPVIAAVRNHHERWDGNGYPDKLAGEKIPLIARIVNCADTWDACTSTRPYQKAMPLADAFKVMEGLRGTQLDPRVLDSLNRVVARRRAAGVRVTEAADEPEPQLPAPAPSSPPGAAPEEPGAAGTVAAGK